MFTHISARKVTVGIFQSIIRKMSQYHNIQLHGVQICAKPSNFWRKTFFQSLPHLTGDTFAINVFVKGTYNVPVKSIYFIADYEGKQEAISPNYSINESKYIVNFSKMTKSGQYEIRVMLRTSEMGFETIAWATAPTVATIHIMDNWKPTIWLWSLIIGAILATIITISIQKLLGII